MDRGYKLILWGFIFLTFHINLGRFYIIPEFIAYAIIYCGMKKISKNYKIKAFKESATCCGVLILISLIIGYVSLHKTDIFIENPIFHILWLSGFGILEMIFVYKFLKGSSELLENGDNTLSKSYEKKSYTYVILASVSLVISNINIAFMFKSIWISIVIFEFCLNLWILHSSRRLGKIIKELVNYK